jgi:hypothetical protein
MLLPLRIRNRKNKINPSAPKEIRITWNNAPIKCEPTSPKIIFAGFVFHQRNPDMHQKLMKLIMKYQQ